MMSFLPSKDREYLKSHKINFEEVEERNQKGLILKQYRLPSRRYDLETTDILILLPSGYPDIAPDMFFLLPWVKLARSQKYPQRADIPYQFKGQNWQRWSRHNRQWRRGVDGIWTMLKRVNNALEVAA